MSLRHPNTGNIVGVRRVLQAGIILWRMLGGAVAFHPRNMRTGSEIQNVFC